MSVSTIDSPMLAEKYFLDATDIANDPGLRHDLRLLLDHKHLSACNLLIVSVQAIDHGGPDYAKRMIAELCQRLVPGDSFVIVSRGLAPKLVLFPSEQVRRNVVLSHLTSCCSRRYQPVA